MIAKRRRKLKISDLKNAKGSETRCWFCGETRNVPAGKYGGMCMSCFLEFHEDDIALELWGAAV